MQATTCMAAADTSSESSPPAGELPLGTRERILSGAAEVYARDGIDGATTREIARVAGVNEVTLFRHFKSKDGLLAAVVGKNFGPSAASSQVEVPQATADLRADLLELARTFDRVLAANLPLVRTMLGEIQRYQEHERQVFHGIFHPLKNALRDRLESAARIGRLKPATSIEILADLFVSMVFMGVLRRNLSHIRRGYSNTAYLQGIVDTVLQGAEVETGA